MELNQQEKGLYETVCGVLGPLSPVSGAPILTVRLGKRKEVCQEAVHGVYDSSPSCARKKRLDQLQGELEETPSPPCWPNIISNQALDNYMPEADIKYQLTAFPAPVYYLLCKAWATRPNKIFIKVHGLDRSYKLPRHLRFLATKGIWLHRGKCFSKQNFAQFQTLGNALEELASCYCQESGFFFCMYEFTDETEDRIPAAQRPKQSREQVHLDFQTASDPLQADMRRAKGGENLSSMEVDEGTKPGAPRQGRSMARRCVQKAQSTSQDAALKLARELAEQLSDVFQQQGIVCSNNNVERKPAICQKSSKQQNYQKLYANLPTALRSKLGESQQPISKAEGEWAKEMKHRIDRIVEQHGGWYPFGNLLPKLKPARSGSSVFHGIPRQARARALSSSSQETVLSEDSVKITAASKADRSSEASMKEAQRATAEDSHCQSLYKPNHPKEKICGNPQDLPNGLPPVLNAENQLRVLTLCALHAWNGEPKMLPGDDTLELMRRNGCCHVNEVGAEEQFLYELNTDRGNRRWRSHNGACFDHWVI